jgi:hypothetical protein
MANSSFYQACSGLAPPSNCALPGAPRKRQSKEEDQRMIQQARNLAKVANSGDLKFRALFTNLDCIGFCVAVRSGKERN